jgi:hypothetical protein
MPVATHGGLSVPIDYTEVDRLRLRPLVLETKFKVTPAVVLADRLVTQLLGFASRHWHECRLQDHVENFLEATEPSSFLWGGLALNIINYARRDDDV